MAKDENRVLPPDKNEYETPMWFFNYLCSRGLDFTLDAFASSSNTRCGRFIDAETDAFKTPWDRGDRGDVWVNPPYSQSVLGKAVWRSAEQALKNSRRVVCLIPPNADTFWWHECVMVHASQIIFIEGRLSFEYRGAPVKGNRGSSCLVVFDGRGQYGSFSPSYGKLNLKGVQ